MRSLALAIFVAAGGCGDDGSRPADASPDTTSGDAGIAEDDAGRPDAFVATDAGPPPECVTDEDCTSFLCVEGECTQTCRDDCDCTEGARCATASHSVPVCVDGAGSCMPAPAPCLAPTWASTAFRNELNRDFADFGLFLQDALEPACAEDARERLIAKLEATLAVPSRSETLGRTVGPFQGWLEGADVFLIFATAAILGGQGLLVPELDALLERTRDTYVSNPTFIGLDFRCGLGSGRWIGGNSCMDDFTVAAPAYAWMAAYERMRGRPYASFVETTEDLIARAFGPDAICIYDSTRPVDTTTGPCNATVADLGTGAAEVVSLNHGAQNIGYGLGLMTLVGTAVVALEVAGVTHVPTATEHAIAMGLLEEGQRHALLDGSAYATDCYRFADGGGGTVVVYRDADCGDLGLQYRPSMFHVAPLYRRFYDAPPATIDGAPVYHYDAFDPSWFGDSPDVFFNPSRRLVYGTMGAAWLLARPPVGGAIP